MSSGTGEFHSFPQTHWSLVHRAGQARGAATPSPDLDELLRRYLPALRTFVRHELKFPCSDAEDLLQSFIADKIVERNLLARADRDRGKFRTFLLGTLTNYAHQQRRVQAAAKRRPATGHPASLPDNVDVPTAAPSPPHQFDVAWARQTVHEAAQKMRQECFRLGRPDIWDVFEGRIVRPAFDAVAPLPYDHIVARLALQSPIQACNLLTTGKRVFARCLRDEVAEYVGGDAIALDGELADLRAALSTAAARRGRAESW